MATYGGRRKPDGPNFDSLRGELKAGAFKPVYIADGQDQQRVKSVVDFLVGKLLGESGAAFNFHQHDCETVEFGTIIQQALSFPMLSSHQLIWAKRADKLLDNAAAEDRFLKYLEKPSPETILILSADKFDGRKKWVKAAKTKGFHYDFAPPSGRDLIDWTLKMATRYEMNFRTETAELLVDLVGDDTQALKCELEKLAAVAADSGSTPDHDELVRLIMANRPVDPFELVKDLGPGRLQAGLERLNAFLAEGKSPYELAPLLIWRIKQVTQVHDLLKEGLSDTDIRSILGISPYALRQAVDVARRWSDPDIRRALKACADCERGIKGSALEPEKVLEKAVIEICS